MKIKKLLTLLIISGLSVSSIHAQSLSDILGKVTGKAGGVTDIVSGVIEGVFTKSNLTLQDLVGSYTANGPAVTFKSENLLQKAGGLAGAATLESKIKPYYEKYGLNNMTLTVTEDANFTMKIKSLSLKGTITKNESDGTFDFNFNVVGFKIGKFTTYIEKSGSSLKLMFDASKLKSFISTVANLTGNSMAQAVGSILDSYDGACVGWKMASTGTPQTQDTPSNTNSTSTDNSSGSPISSGLDKLKGILKGGNK